MHHRQRSNAAPALTAVRVVSVCWPLLVTVEGELVPNPELAAHIRELLLENPHVGEVLQVRSVEVDDRVTLVGVRVSVLNLPQVLDLPPVLAQLRALVREAAPHAEAIFVEPDVTERHNVHVSTESIVIRSVD